MKQKALITITGIGTFIAGAMFSPFLAHMTLPAKAAPPTLTPAPSGGSLATLLAGKVYPISVKAEDIDSSYHILVMVDAQDKQSAYATKGDIFTVAGESFIVGYYTQFTTNPSRGPRPKPGTTGDLTLINIHSIQAMGGISTISPISASDSDDSTAPTSPSNVTPSAPGDAGK